MVDDGLILVTGAAGQLGSVGRTVTGLLLDRGFPVRAMVRREDERAASLRAVGAQVVVGDLLEPGDVYRVVSGCGRVYFGMSVSVCRSGPRNLRFRPQRTSPLSKRKVDHQANRKPEKEADPGFKR
jgi:uncharacterized protein YbjT (DUF2867 family)